LLQQLSVTDLAPEQDAEEENDGSDTDAREQLLRIPDLILAIEEPELYLHPSRSRYLSKVMDNLTRAPNKVNEPRTQILFATHSPYFISMDKFDRVRLARKVPAPGHEPLQCQLSEYSCIAAAKRLADVTERNPKEFTAESFAVRSAHIMTSMVNEGFFADVVVVVEGVADVAILWAMQEILDKKWDGHGIVLIAADGKNNIDRPVVVFSGLRIPTYFIFDGDNRYAGKREERDTVKSNTILLRLAGATTLEDFPATQTHPTWAVFSDELETELKSVNEKAFLSVREEVANELGYDKPSTLLKNPYAASCFLKRMYKSGHRIQILEDIVEHATNLRAP
jgi:predicted ATP-dependent endonuclease of OLD family